MNSPSDSLLAFATAESPRPVLTPVAAVVILSHTIRALNLTREVTLGDVEVRRESAALLQQIRSEIARDVVNGFVGASPVEF